MYKKIFREMLAARDMKKSVGIVTVEYQCVTSALCKLFHSNLIMRQTVATEFQIAGTTESGK